MDMNMTEISTIMYDKAVSKNLTINDAIQMLKECAEFRTLSKKLRAFAKDRDIKKLLIEGLCKNHPEANPDTINRKVRNWLNDRQNTLHKEDAIELCFVLGLTLDESDKLIAMICDEALHWRNLDEIPYIFALSKNMSYAQAVELHQKIKIVLSETVDKEQPKPSFTSIIKTEIESISDESELISYIINTKSKLGALHNTAYNNFIEMLDALENPETELFDDDDYYPTSEKYSISKILQSYLHKDAVKEPSSDLEKAIIRNWPNETVLSNMKNRHTDITRKVIILLFFATYDCDLIEDEEEIMEKPANEIFDEFYKNMNNMLASCGFRQLDPRSPFDWIIIYCMCDKHSYKTDDEYYDIDTTLSDFLRGLFPDKNTETN